jgi:hypothetical protein
LLLSMDSLFISGLSGLGLLISAWRASFASPTVFWKGSVSEELILRSYQCHLFPLLQLF